MGTKIISALAEEIKKGQKQISAMITHGTKSLSLKLLRVMMPYCNKYYQQYFRCIQAKMNPAFQNLAHNFIDHIHNIIS